MDEELGQGLASGFNEGSKNFINAMGAVRQMRMQAQKNDIDNKKAMLDIKKMELELDPEVVAQNKELLSAKIKAQKSMDQFNIMRATREARKVKQNAQEAMQKRQGLLMGRKMVLDALSDPAMSGRVGVSSGGMPYLSPERASALDLWSGLDGASDAAPEATVTGKIRVRNKETGATGTISAAKFNPDKYDRI